MSRRLGKTLFNTSGQALLLCMMLGLVSVIALSAVFFMNQSSTFHQLISSKRNQVVSVNEDGLAYAISVLSVNSTTWANALAGGFPTDCTSGQTFSAPSGGQFQLTCSNSTASNPGLQPSYQVAVTVLGSIAGGANPSNTYSRVVKAYLSQRTLGVDMPTAVHAGAAVQFVAAPVFAPGSGSLNVHWGPVVCLDSNPPDTWSVVDPIDTGLYPRKFSTGPIDGTVLNSGGELMNPRSAGGVLSDHKEFWANAPIQTPPFIYETYYINAAQNETAVTPPTYPATSTVNPAGGNVQTAGCINPNCGYFQPGGDYAVFDGTTYGAPGSPVVIYVNGNAIFKNVTFINATVIVTGQLSIISDAGGIPMNVHIPLNAAAEYPYISSGTPPAWPCSTLVSVGTCKSLTNNVFPSGKVQFLGFLYAKGSMIVGSPNATSSMAWNMSGALLVGDATQPPGTSGALFVGSPGTPYTASLNVVYDDIIGHNIQVNPISSSGQIRVEPDWIQEVPPT